MSESVSTKAAETIPIAAVARRIHLKRTKSLKIQLNTSLQFISPWSALDIKEGDYLLRIGSQKVTKKGINQIQNMLAKIEIGSQFSIDVMAKGKVPSHFTMTQAKVNPDRFIVMKNFSNSSKLAKIHVVESIQGGQDHFFPKERAISPKLSSS